MARASWDNPHLIAALAARSPEGVTEYQLLHQILSEANSLRWEEEDQGNQVSLEETLFHVFMQRMEKYE